MKNYVSSGTTVTVSAPTDVESGGFVRIGSLTGFAQSDALASEDVALVTRGVFADILAAKSTDMAVGDVVYFDGTAFTASADDGAGNAYDAVGIVVGGGSSDGTNATIDVMI